MGRKILGTDVAGILASALGSGAEAGTLLVASRGARAAGALASGPQVTYAEHSFRGFADSTARSRAPRSVVQRARRAVLILGDTLSPAATPKVGDRITFQGETGEVLHVDTDPDAASHLALIHD